MKLLLLKTLIADVNTPNTYLNYKYLWFGLSISLILFIIVRIIYFYRKGEVERAERCTRFFIASLSIIVLGLIVYYYMFY